MWAQAPTHIGGSVLGEAMPTWAEEMWADSLNVFLLVSGAACKLWHSADPTRKYLFYRTGYCLCFSPSQRLIPKATGNVHTHREEARSLC